MVWLAHITRLCCSEKLDLAYHGQPDIRGKAACMNPANLSMRLKGDTDTHLSNSCEENQASNETKASNLHLLLQIIFVHFLFPVQNIALLCSIYTTVVLAVQRYLAISKPLEYYIDGATASAGERDCLRAHVHVTRIKRGRMISPDPSGRVRPYLEDLSLSTNYQRQ